jgi:hypothetical protein
MSGALCAASGLVLWRRRRRRVLGFPPPHNHNHNVSKSYPEKDMKLTVTTAPSSSSSSTPSLTESSQPTPTTHSFDLEKKLVSLFEDLHTSHPHHAIFGAPTAGHIRLPLQHARANGQCWINVAKKIGRWVRGEMGDKLGERTCWMSTQAQLQITQPNGRHSVQVLTQVTVVRLLAFLANPTNDNWLKLSPAPPLRPIDFPFSHTCARGGPRPDQILNTVCINRLYHGRFATRGENESHKLCSNGARVLCPGHGDDPADLVKCVFTHPDGTLMPCRMREDSVPMCNCATKCYGL